MRRVAIVMGGRSSEHDISLASARSVMDALDPSRYDVVAIEIGRDGRWQLGQLGNKRRLQAIVQYEEYCESLAAGRHNSKRGNR